MFLTQIIVILSLLFHSAQRDAFDLDIACSLQVEIAKLERLLQLKTLECAKVRKMARNILMQRTDIETHFLDALDSVREDFSIARYASVNMLLLLRLHSPKPFQNY